MTLVAACLAAVVGVCASTYSLWIVTALLPLAVVSLFFCSSGSRKVIILSIAVGFVFGFLRCQLYIRPSEGKIVTVGVVYRAEENYSLVATLKGNFYLAQGGNEIGDLLRLNGESGALGFSHYEGSFDFESYLHHRFVFRELRSTTPVTILSAPLRINAFKSHCLRFLDEGARELGASIVFGDAPSSVPYYHNLQNLGIARFLTLSGFHLGFIFHLLDQAGNPRLKAAAPGMKTALSLLMLILTSFKFAFLRIFLDQILRWRMRRKGWQLARLPYLGLLSLFLIAVNPHFILEAGYIYTFVILVGLAVLKGVAPRLLRGKIASFITVELLLIPLQFYRQCSFDLLSFLVGLIFAPLLLAVFIFSLLLLVAPPFGRVLNFQYLSLDLLFKKIADVDLVVVSGEVSPLLVLVIYLIALSACFFLYLRKKKAAFGGILLVCSALLLHILPSGEPKTEIHFVDVGQGDSTLVRIKGRNYLFDTGGARGKDLAKECLIPYFHRLKITSLQAVFITHQDYDHCGALTSLKNSFSIGQIYSNEVETLEFSGLRVSNLNSVKQAGDSNLGSAVFLLEIGEKSVLIMGDAPREVERRITAQNPQLHADILKVGHHGSDTSSDFNFLKAIDPQVAIISCGYRNRYGHPSPATLATLTALDIPYRRTDVEGTVRLRL